MEASSPTAIAAARASELTGIGVMVLGGLLVIAGFVLRIGSRNAPSNTADDGPFACGWPVTWRRSVTTVMVA